MQPFREDLRGKSKYLRAAVKAAVVHVISLALHASMAATTPGSDGPMEIPLGLTIIQSLVFTLIGAGVAWLIAKRSDRAPRI